MATRTTMTTTTPTSMLTRATLHPRPLASLAHQTPSSLMQPYLLLVQIIRILIQIHTLPSRDPLRAAHCPRIRLDASASALSLTPHFTVTRLPRARPLFRRRQIWQRKSLPSVHSRNPQTTAVGRAPVLTLFLLLIRACRSPMIRTNTCTRPMKNLTLGRRLRLRAFSRLLLRPRLPATLMATHIALVR
jgi:hypothetical protein